VGNQCPRSISNGMSSDNKNIGSLISELRVERGLTQKEFASLLRTSQSAVARMERGGQNFTTEMLTKISQVLDKDIIKLATGTVSFQIDGGKKLHGSVTTNTSKNGTVALLCASLLNKNTTTLRNIPHIEEVNRLIEVLESIGVLITWNKNDLVIVPPKKLALESINRESAAKTRSILMFIGPLIHLFDSFEIPQAGGCKLGSRTIRPHLYALENLGVHIETKTDRYIVSHKKLHENTIILFESSETAQQVALMAAARIPGVTTIKYATSNYMVRDTCYFLQKLGVQVDGIGTSTLTVHGVKEIDVPVTYCPSEDPIDAMLFISLAATTNSEIIIKACPIDFLELELLYLEKMGFKYKILREYKAKNGYTNLVDIKTLHFKKLVALEEKVHSRPYPGLNADNLPFFVPVATQAEGQTLIHDWMYDNRAIYFTDFTKLGADVILADPHRLYVKGPTKFRPADMVAPPALRPAAIILIGMLAASGRSYLRNVYSILRGYEDLAKRLRKLGAGITVLRGV